MDYQSHHHSADGRTADSHGNIHETAMDYQSHHHSADGRTADSHGNIHETAMDYQSHHYIDGHHGNMYETSTAMGYYRDSYSGYAAESYGHSHQAGTAMAYHQRHVLVTSVTSQSTARPTSLADAVDQTYQWPANLTQACQPDK